MIDVLALAAVCAPTVAPETIAAIVEVESAGNPYAIGIVDGVLPRQPNSLPEAISTAEYLIENGWSFSVGLAQIHIDNLQRLNISIPDAFEPCKNIELAEFVLTDCYLRAPADGRLDSALSCYYSGHFSRGHVVEPSGTSYVERIRQAALPP